MDLRFPALPALALGLCVTTTAHAAVILQQGFEASAADTWGYTTTPDSYNTETTGNPLAVNGTNEDVWAVIEAFTNDIDTPASGAFFWGIQDIENTVYSGLHSINFETVDLSSWTDVQLQFAYQAIGFDAGERLGYRLNGVESTLLSGASGGTSTAGWELMQLALGSIDRLDFVLLAEQDGGADYAGFDQVVLTGTPRTTSQPRIRSTVPAPASPALLLAGLGILGWYWQVSRAAWRGDS